MKYEKDLSIIIPYISEYPQVLFTIQSAAQSLMDSGLNFEIIAINNYSEQAREQAQQSAENSFKKFYPELKKFERTGNRTEFFNSIYEFHKGIYPTYEDRSGEAIKAASRINDWLVYMEVTDTLSHWECKRQACQVAKVKHLFFICISFNVVNECWGRFSCVYRLIIS